MMFLRFLLALGLAGGSAVVSLWGFLLCVCGGFRELL